MSLKPIKVFLLNAPEDHEYLTRLRTQLRILENKGILDNWDNTEIRGGMVISDVIEDNLQKSEIFIPLVSADYLASDDCQAIQKKAVAMGKKILPVIVRDCGWKWDDDLEKHKAFPQKEDGQTSPVSNWQNKGAAYMSITNGIYEMLKPILEEQKKSKSKLPNKKFDNGYALLIGVGNDLPITVKDANAVGNVLQNQAAYPPSQVQIVTEAAASREGILKAFDDLIAQTKNNQDATVMVYYSGHGGFIDLPEGKKQYFLVPNDFDRNNIKDKWITSEEFSAKINTISSKKLVVLLDCCHAAGIPKSIVKKFNFTKAAETLVEQLDKGSGKVVMASSKDDEESLIYANEPYSTFTHSLIEALNGKALHRNDGYVRILNVVDYLLEKVSKRTNGKQNPYLKKVENLNENFAVCALGTTSKEDSDSEDNNGKDNNKSTDSNLTNNPPTNMSNNRLNKEIARLEKRIQSKQKSIDRCHDTIDRLDDSIGSMNVMTDILDINKLEKQKELIEEQLEKYENDVKELEEKLTQLKSGTSSKSSNHTTRNTIEKNNPVPPSTPKIPTTIPEIRMAIIGEQLEEAFEAMLKLIGDRDNDLITQVMLQSASYSSMRRDKRNGTITPDRADMIQARIRHNSLDILKDIEEL